MTTDPPSDRFHPQRTDFALVALGCVSLALYIKGVHDQGTQRILTFTTGALAQMAPYFLASWVIVRFARPSRSTLVIA